jgi:hypothetical protein
MVELTTLRVLFRARSRMPPPVFDATRFPANNTVPVPETKPPPLPEAAAFSVKRLLKISSPGPKLSTKRPPPHLPALL